MYNNKDNQLFLQTTTHDANAINKAAIGQRW